MLVGLGQSVEYGGLQLPRSPLLGASKVWESVTPFVPTRHPKTVRGVEVDTIVDLSTSGRVRPFE